MTMRQQFVLLAVLVTAIIVALAAYDPSWLWAFVFVGPIIMLGVYDMLQSQHGVLRL